MSKKEIFITGYDLKRLRRLVNRAKQSKGYQRNRKYFEDLEAELDRALILASGQTPVDVITMNCMVRFTDLDTGESETYTLVFPEDANIENGKISILAPIGISLLGCKIGSEIEWTAPAGVRKLRVEEILYRPEVSGDYHLNT